MSQDVSLPEPPTPGDGPAQAPRKRRRWPIILLVIAGVLGLLMATGVLSFEFHASVGTTADSPGFLNYARSGASFDYPASWGVFGPLTNVEGQTGEKYLRWSETVGPADGTPADILILDQYALKRDASTATSKLLQSNTAYLLQQFAAHLNGEVMSGPYPVQFPQGRAYGGVVHITVNGVPVLATLVFDFDGGNEFFFNCQATHGFEAEMASGCNQIEASFVANP